MITLRSFHCILTKNYCQLLEKKHIFSTFFTNFDFYFLQFGANAYFQFSTPFSAFSWVIFFIMWWLIFWLPIATILLPTTILLGQVRLPPFIPDFFKEAKLKKDAEEIPRGLVARNSNNSFWEFYIPISQMVWYG